MTDVDKILEERQKTHGEFERVASVTRFIQSELGLIHYDEKPYTCVQREALHMICNKLARIFCGDPNVKDHWDDIAGYASLVSKSIEYRQEPCTSAPQQLSSGSQEVCSPAVDETVVHQPLSGKKVSSEQLTSALAVVRQMSRSSNQDEDLKYHRFFSGLLP